MILPRPSESDTLVKGDYIRTISNWRSHFPEEQFFVGFFDDIVQTPSRFLSSVFAFLGVESSEEYVTQLAFTQINASPQQEMPPEFRLFLSSRYYPQIKALSETLGGHADQWLHDVESLLSSTYPKIALASVPKSEKRPETGL